MLPSGRKSRNPFTEKLSKQEEKKRITIPWNSALFFQFGLVLVLLATFWVVESEWKLRLNFISKNDKRMVNEKIDTHQYRLEPEVIKRDQIQPNKLIRREQKMSLVSTFTPIDNTLSVVETTIPGTQMDQNMSIDPPMILPDPKKPNGKESLFGVQQVPVFPGCEFLTTNEERKECFQSKIQQFILRKFDFDKFSEKYSGQIKRISVQFTVNKQGQMAELKAVSSDKDLSEEAVRVISKLPQMTPGKNNGLPVEVVYTVPISLHNTY